MAGNPQIEHFDAVVIGSGFGGAVAAFRLSEAGLSVVVLERGAPYPPGSFPRTPRGIKANFWAPASGLLGLYEVWSFSHVAAIVASGLGGGSLIYANVMLRKPQNTFAGWPLSYEALETHYTRVEEVLDPRPFPADAEPYASTPKTQAFARAAAAAGLEVERPPLAIAFAAGDAPPAPGLPLPPDDNLHGRQRRTCRLCGECDVGCNEGAKNTLDFNFLSMAMRRGAQIRTCCDAIGVAPATGAGGGYTVRYLQHVSARGAHPDHLLDPTLELDRTVRARIVVLAAGTLGSTRLLLASRAALPGLSPQLGRGFSANGDTITVARDCRAGEGRRRRRPWRRLDPSVGPVITVSASSRNGPDLWLQDAGGPDVSEWLWQGLELPGDLWGMRKVALRRTLARLRGRRETRLGADLARLLGSTRSSSAMLPLLHMGLDMPGGRLRLRGDTLELDWSPRNESAPYYHASYAAARRVARELGGRLGPRWFVRRNRGPTVHPLGGCPMGESWRDGVVDSWGEVFGRPGLFVADGSVLPGPVGPNPGLTIAAVADRFAERMIERARESA